MNDLICISSIVIAIKLSDRTPNSWMWITKSITCSKLLTGTIWSINAKQRSHVKFGLLWLDCDSQIRTKLANLWGIFDPILKNGLFDAQSFRFKKESFWSQESSPWCTSQDSRTSYGSPGGASMIMSLIHHHTCIMPLVHFTWMDGERKEEEGSFKKSHTLKIDYN
jgi:hypothetical protein